MAKKIYTRKERIVCDLYDKEIERFHALRVYKVKGVVHLKPKMDVIREALFGTAN